MGRQSVVIRTIAIIALAGALTAALWLTASPEALACDCNTATSSTIQHADGALVGQIVAVFLPEERGWWGGQVVAKVEVITDIKENLSDIVYISNTRSEDADSCGGVSWRVGGRIATTFYEDEGAFHGGGACASLPDDLVNNWEPALTIGGQATLLLSGGSASTIINSARAVAYNRTGVPIAFGFEPGRVLSSSICPGQEVMAELVFEEGKRHRTIDTRSLKTFEITSSVPLAFEGERLQPSDVRCDSSDGATVIFDSYRLSDGTIRPTASSQQFPAAIDIPDLAYDEKFETSTTAPISPEGWMEFARELDPPITIDAPDTPATVAHIGPGYSFGLADALASAAETGIVVDDLAAAAAATDDADDELAVGAGPSAETNSNSFFWIVGLVMAFAASAVIFRSRR